MSEPCTLIRRCHRLLRRLRDLRQELESGHDPSFTTEQIRFLENRFTEMRFILLENSPLNERRIP
jgi:hypothetical protein